MGRRAGAALAAVVALAAFGNPARAEAAVTGSLQITAGPARLEVPQAERAAWSSGGTANVQQAGAWLRGHAAMRSSGVEVRLTWPASLVRRVIVAAASGQGSISVPQAVARVTLTAPLVRQRYRNDCEVTALSIALREAVSQDRLQRELRLAAPFEARVAGRRTVWGDPELGFVGNVAGGGYGVYDRPLLAVARRHNGGAENLTGRPLATMLAALRDGHPIVAWVTLGVSRPFTWRTPAGAVVHADKAEHAVTLTSWSRGLIGYVDPWDGRLKSLAVADLAARWLPLGRRAIALSARLARAG